MVLCDREESSLVTRGFNRGAKCKETSEFVKFLKKNQSHPSLPQPSPVKTPDRMSASWRRRERDFIFGTKDSEVQAYFEYLSTLNPIQLLNLPKPHSPLVVMCYHFAVKKGPKKRVTIDLDQNIIWQVEVELRVMTLKEKFDVAFAEETLKETLKEEALTT